MIVSKKTPQGGMMISRAEAFKLLRAHCAEEVLLKHYLATEAVMQTPARRLGQDPDRWGIASLLHDLDYDATNGDPARHTLRTEEILRNQGVDEEIIDAIEAHNAEALQRTREKPFHFAITCAESITGLIVAMALVYPDKKISSVRPSSIINRSRRWPLGQ
jgi:putative nucleotidyltransferase with HDIG domain